jgi:hypothetical protein
LLLIGCAVVILVVILGGDGMLLWLVGLGRLWLVFLLLWKLFVLLRLRLSNS